MFKQNNHFMIKYKIEIVNNKFHKKLNPKMRDSGQKMIIMIREKKRK